MSLQDQDLRTARRILHSAPHAVSSEDIRRPPGAEVAVTPAQWTIAALAVTGLLATFVLSPLSGFALVHAAFFAVFMVACELKLIMALLALAPRRRRARRLDDAPRYTIIAPLYDEAAVVPQLISALAAIDYPPERLQILIVLEADDDETLEAVLALDAPPHIQALVAGPGHPRTKPRACNIALAMATGDIVVVYDAEDRPHPRQLREAAARFAAGPPQLACLQAPLRIDSADGFTARQFAIEYAAQFEVMLPAFARFKIPFPLGGTSNHFRADALREVGGWDPFNVTEDADIGFRLAQYGYRLDVLDLPTFEDAPPSFEHWLPQRSRWIKGYMQTFGVHMRRPLHGGWRRLVAFQLTLGFSIASAFVHAPLSGWVVVQITLMLLAPAPARLHGGDLALLVIGWTSTTFAMVVGSRLAHGEVRWRDILSAPLYWPLQSMAALHALIRLVAQPHHWDKTQHRPVKPAVAGRPAP